MTGEVESMQPLVLEDSQVVLETDTPPTPPPPPPPSTLYPKIHKLSDFIYKMKTLEREDNPITSVQLTGSVKLHGTHADIVYASSTSDVFRLQSRNRKELVPGSEDNSGFAAFVASLSKGRILELRNRVVARYRKLNPGVVVSIEGEIILAGEWCGQGIQKGVAISQLPKFWVIVSVNIDGRWVDDTRYADMCDEDARIFNIGKVGFYRHELRMEDIPASEKEIKRLVDEVERDCSFAKALGAKPGKGEGIVWKATDYCGESEFWFKSKGDLLAVSNSDKLPASAVDAKNRERVDNFARAIVTEVRLEQGWDNLGQKDGRQLGPFLKWITTDCVTEEKREMETLEISKGKLSPAIAAIARPWFWQKLKIEGGK